ncbi:SurA N-terminal domain-containing protein [Roseivirga sp.]|nr:SurA N-terminal domain-containing protein [Roseivirga sp.]
MAIINTLREKMGKLLIVVVGLSIVAFVLGDLLGQNSSLLGNSRNVGEIDGEEISQEDFATMVQNAQRNAGYPSGNPQIMQFLRDQVWNSIIADVAYSNKLDELGLEIGPNERVDMVQGRNLSPEMGNFFLQRIGSNDPSSIKQYLASIEFDPNEQNLFASYERNAMVQRTIQKFENLLAKTEYVTLAEAQKVYQEQLGFRSVEYLSVPFSSVSNEQIGTIPDNEIRAYLQSHEDEFTVEETRDVDFVSFPVIPSAKDTADYDRQMADIKARLESGDNDSIYAMSITEQGSGFSEYDPTALPIPVADKLTSLKEGDIIGPDLENGIYTIHKLTEIVPTDSEFARASQIVFNIAGLSAADVAGVKTKANDILRQIRNGADFADMAREHSQGAYNNVGGDTGWMKKGDTRTTDIEEAVFGTTRKGLIRRLVETTNNIYILNVTEPKIKNRYKVAQVIVELTPSTQTIDAVYRQAGLFASDVSSTDEFNDYAAENGYAVFNGNGIDKNAISIGRLTNARQIVSWLYGEATMGDVKDFDLDNEYVVAVYRDKRDEGVQSLEDVRIQIAGKLMNDKKAEFIKAKINGLSGTVSAMASAYGPEASVYSNGALKLADVSLSNVGVAPEAIGAAFALKNVGDKTKAYVVDNQGVVVVELKSVSAAAEIGDYTSYENQILQAAFAAIQGKLRQAVVDRVEVVDERYKFF